MNKRIMRKLLLPIIFGALAFQGVESIAPRMQTNYSPRSASNLGDYAFESINDYLQFDEAMTNATDGTILRLGCDVYLWDGFTVPDYTLVTIDLNGHSLMFFDNSGSGNNVNLGFQSTLLIQNGTYTGRFDIGNCYDGTVILNNMTYDINPNSQEYDYDLLSPEGVIYAGNCNFWIVNGSSIKRINTEEGNINLDSVGLNEWGPHHNDPTDENEINKYCVKYEYENPVNYLVGNANIWSACSSLSDAIDLVAHDNVTYKRILALKDLTNEDDVVIDDIQVCFDLCNHQLDFETSYLQFNDLTGKTFFRNGYYKGSYLDLRDGEGDFVLENIYCDSELKNDSHNITVNGGYYKDFSAGIGTLIINDGYFERDIYGADVRINGGYYKYNPAGYFYELGVECLTTEKRENNVVFNYTVKLTEPNSQNDYKAALNGSSIEGASFQWYRNTIDYSLADSTIVEDLICGTFVDYGAVKTALYEGHNAVGVRLVNSLFNEGDRITFKSEVPVSLYDSDMGDLENLGFNTYAYELKAYYGSYYFCVVTESSTTLTDISRKVITEASLEGQTSASLSSSLSLDNTDYFCKLYRDGKYIRTTQKIHPKSINFVCGTMGATGNNPAYVYQFAGRSITLPSNPYSLSCHNFDGWYSGENKITTSTYLVTDDETLYALLEEGEHTWDDGVVITAATCTTNGQMKYTCTSCGKTKFEDIQAKGYHTKGQHFDANSPTCIADGNIEYWKCKYCDVYLDSDGNVITDIAVSATGHAYSNEWSYDETNHYHEATCGCSISHKDVGAHTFDDGVVTSNATETSLGVKKYTCTVCGYYENQDIPLLTHQKGMHHNAEPATCSTNGNVEYWDCVNCDGKLNASGELISNVTIPATGHSYSEDWSHDGSNHWHASTCGHSDEKSSTAAHTWNEGTVTTQPTETAKGVKTFTCTVCSQTKTEDVEMLTHEKGMHHDAVPATCLTDGNIEYWDCLNCDGKLDAEGNLLSSVVTPATGHSYSSEWTHDDNQHWHASTCGHSDEKSDVANHTWNEGVVTTNPTETTKGVKTYTCTVCGTTKTEDVTMLTHQKGTHHNAVAATCEAAGTVEYWDCANCSDKLDANGNVLSSIVVPATGHNVVKHEQEDGKVGTSGHKAYYECSVCHKCFEDAEATTTIVNINNWKQKGGNGYVPANNTPVIVPSSVVLGIIVLYFIGYVALYRQGVLDNKKIKVIYRWLPRGNKNKA